MLHYCAQQILAFQVDRGNSQRTEQNVLMTMARLEEWGLALNHRKKNLPRTKDK